MITASDCKYHDSRISLPGGRSLRISFDQDPYQDPPWENSDGHGPIRSIRSREQKLPGERILGRSRNLYAYDVQLAMRIAKRDGWGLLPDDVVKLGNSLGRPPTAGEIRAAAVEADLKFLAGWINEEWSYLTIGVQLMDADGREIAADYVGGVESLGSYASEQAAEMANELVRAQDKEEAEASYWLAREVVTC